MTAKLYSSYKDSGSIWLNKVPAHWKVAPLKRLLNIQNGADQKAVESEEGFPIYGSGGIFGYANQYLYDGKSVLLGRKGTIDKPLFVDGKFWTVDTMYWSKILSTADPKFSYYLSTRIPFDFYSTSTALPSMTKGDLGSHIVAYPEVEEQQRIANYLDRETAKIDELIQKQEKLVELLIEKRASYIEKVITKGLNSNVKFKDSDILWIGEIPDKWTVKRLKFLADITTGDKDTVDADENGEYPFFVRSQTIEKIGTFTYDCEAVLTAGDGAGVGKVFHYVSGKFDFHQRVYMISNFREIKGKFFFYYLSSLFAKVALDGGAKSTVDSLRRHQFTNFPITVPSLDEQDEIIEHIETFSWRIDSLMERSKTSIDLLKEHRTSLISAAVTGKIDLRELV